MSLAPQLVSKAELGETASTSVKWRKNGSVLMFGGDAIPASLFVLGIVMSMAADARLRYRHGGSWHQGCLTAAGAGLAFLACACVIR